MTPVDTLHRAITLPFKALLVVGLCLAINLMTSPGHWWVQWVAFGMGIAIAVAWFRALRLLVAGGALALIGAWAYRRWGSEGRDRVQRWVDTAARR